MDQVLPAPPRRPHPIRQALLSGLGVLLPPLLTIVILVWIWQTVRAYVLEPVTAEVRNVLVLTTADIRDDLPGAKPNDDGTVAFEGVDYRQLDDGKFVPETVCNTVLKHVGGPAMPTSAGGVYRQYVELVYLRPIVVTPVFLVVFVGLMYLLGSLFAAGVGRVIWTNLEDAITRLPVVRSVYGAAKQVTDYMFSEGELEPGVKFKRVVAFEHPHPGQWQIGFVAGEGLRQVRELAGEPLVTVLVSVNPIPMSGYIRLLPKSQVHDLDMTFDQAIHYIVSFGVVLPAGQTGIGNRESGVGAREAKPHLPEA